jgi:hypothetical protein
VADLLVAPLWVVPVASLPCVSLVTKAHVAKGRGTGAEDEVEGLTE